MVDTNTPYIDNSGNVIVPFNADPKYHFWNGGQSLSATLVEINATEKIWKKHSEKPYPGHAA
jgi:hypothetical protein